MHSQSWVPVALVKYPILTMITGSIDVSFSVIALSEALMASQLLFRLFLD